MAWPDPDTGRVPFLEALAWFRARVPITPGRWRRLSREARRRAFRVAGVTRLDVVTSVWRAIERALAEGWSLEQFQEAVADDLLREWAGTTLNPAQRLETIFRANTQAAYQAGRYAQMTDPDVLSARPYWMYDALLDARTTELCRSLHGTILPADHPWWRSRYPPNHFGCRSGVRSLTQAGAERRGGVSPDPPALEADAGFDTLPNLTDWEPDLSKYPSEVVSAYQRALGGDPP